MSEEKFEVNWGLGIGSIVYCFILFHLIETIYDFSFLLAGILMLPLFPISIVVPFFIVNVVKRMKGKKNFNETIGIIIFILIGFAVSIWKDS